MNKILGRCFMVGLLVLMVACSGGSGIKSKFINTPTRESSPIYQELGQVTIALVRVDSGSNIRPYCSGVWISEKEILTAGHCIEHDDFGIISPIDDFVYYIIQKEVRGVGELPAAIHLGQVKYYSNETDLAIIKVALGGIPAHKVAPLAMEMPGVGEMVHIVGHPRGLYWTFSDGALSAYRHDTSIGSALQIDATVWFGNSGGGAFDSSGNLIGICSRLTGVPNMSLFVHVDSVKEALQKMKEEALASEKKALEDQAPKDETPKAEPSSI